MLNFAPEKMLFVAFIAMIVLGPEKLPEVARKVGRIMGELRRVSEGFQAELREAIDDTSGASTVREVSRSTYDMTPVDATARPAEAGEGDEPPEIVATGPAADDEQ